MTYATRFTLATLGLSLAACAHSAQGGLCAAPATPGSNTLPTTESSSGRFVVLADQTSSAAPHGRQCAPTPEALQCDAFASSPAPGCDTKPWAP